MVGPELPIIALGFFLSVGLFLHAEYPTKVASIEGVTEYRLGNGARVLRWTYAAERLVLYFQDQTGFSRYRLTPTSRAEYQRVLMRVRQSRQ